MHRRRVLMSTGTAMAGVIGISGCLSFGVGSEDPSAELCFARIFNEDDQSHTLELTVEAPSEDGDDTEEVFVESYDLAANSLKRVEPDLDGSDQYVVRATANGVTARVSLPEQVKMADGKPEGIALTFRVVSGTNFPWEATPFPEC